MADPIQVRGFSLFERVFIAAIWVALAAFCYWLTWTRVWANPWMGYALGALCFYVALYWMRAPAVMVSADDAGMTYAGKRRFTVSSRAAGYVPFLAALHAHTHGTAAAMQGLGDDPAQAQAALRGIQGGRLKLIFVFLAVLGMMLALIASLRHPQRGDERAHPAEGRSGEDTSELPSPDHL